MFVGLCGSVGGVGDIGDCLILCALLPASFGMVLCACAFSYLPVLVV